MSVGSTILLSLADISVILENLLLLPVREFISHHDFLIFFDFAIFKPTVKEISLTPTQLNVYFIP